MAIQAEWIGFAEGSTLDSRQALTLVGFNQAAITAKELPYKWQSQIVVIAGEADAGADEGESPASAPNELNGLLTVTMKDPSGNVIASISNFVNASRKHPRVPASIVMAVLVSLDVKEYGRYEVEVTVKESPDSQVTSRKFQYLYVIDELEP